MYEFVEYRVSDAMTDRPVTIRPNTTLAEVEALFEKHDYDCLPVCDERDRLLGVVTKLDFLRAFAFSRDTMVPRYQDIMKRPADTVMTIAPITVTPDMPLTRILQLMIDTRHKSFPVMLGKLPVGMIARQDIVRALHRAAAGEEAPSAHPRENETWMITPSCVM
jgi:CBS domain-containing protein